MLERSLQTSYLDAPVLITEQTWLENIVPIVSICCITYNHENFIRSSLDGFLMQETTFPVEILIHDDASTDNTANIIREYEKRYPHIIKPIYQVENQYSKGIRPGSQINTPRAQGKYIAFCEGDDYWTDPLKLQKQVEFFDNNPDYGLVHTDDSIYIQDTGKIHPSYRELKKFIIPTGEVFFPLLNDNFIASLTVMVRSEVYWQAIRNLRSWIDPELILDYSLWLEISRISKVHYINDVTSMYRVSQGTVSRPGSEMAASLFKKKIFNIVDGFFKNYQIDKKIVDTYKQKFFSDFLRTRYRHSEYYQFVEEIRDFSPTNLKDKILLYFLQHSYPRCFFQALEIPAWLCRKLKS